MRLAAFLSFAMTLVLTPIVILVLHRWKIMDVPSERSSHVVQTPRGGGLGLALGAVSGALIAGFVGVAEVWSMTTLLVCSLTFAVVGFIDDVRTLDVKPRLTAQLLCAVLFVGPWFYSNGPVAGTVIRVALAIIAVVWVMGYLNAFNFMDGINGISGLQTAVVGGTFAYIGWSDGIRIVEVCGGVIAAAAIGFLPFNFPRARVFLGDVGSYFIGTWIAITALIALAWNIQLEAVAAPLVIYLADTSFTLFNRVRRGEDWTTSHRQHVYQRLIDHGWSHTRTAFLVTAFTGACGYLGLFSLHHGWGVRAAADAAIAVLVVVYLALPRLLARTTTEAVGRRASPPLHT